MSGYVLKLQKNIFVIALAAAIFLGFSMSYLSSVALRYFFPTKITSMKVTAKKQVAENTPFRGLDEFISVVTGNFIRGEDIAFGAVKRGGTISTEDGEILLLGTLAGSPDFARAAIQVVGKREIHEYGIGTTVVGFQIKSILSNSVIVEKSGTSLQILIGEKSGDAQRKPQEEAAGGSGGQATSSKQLTISRDRLLALTKDQSALLKNKFSPVQRGNKILGFKLLYVPANNFLYELGARSGDIIRRFNGQPMENVEKMYEMWQSIKTMDSVTVDIERGGKIVTFEIVIQN